MTGMTEVAISLLEKGKHTPQVATKQRIEGILGERVNWILTKKIGELKSKYGSIKVEVDESGATFITPLHTKPIEEE